MCKYTSIHTIGQSWMHANTYTHGDAYMNEHRHIYQVLQEKHVHVHIHNEDYSIKNKISLRFISLNAWSKLWAGLDVERVDIQNLFWRIAIETLLKRHFEMPPILKSNCVSYLWTWSKKLLRVKRVYILKAYFLDEKLNSSCVSYILEVSY